MSSSMKSHMEIATAKRKFAFISKTFSEIMCTYKKTSDFFNLGKRRPVVLPEYTNIELCRAKMSKSPTSSGCTIKCIQLIIQLSLIVTVGHVIVFRYVCYCGKIMKTLTKYRGFNQLCYFSRKPNFFKYIAGLDPKYAANEKKHFVKYIYLFCLGKNLNTFEYMVHKTSDLPPL